MSWFNIFPKNRINESILNLYLEIELLIDAIDKKLQDYLSHVVSLEYYNSNSKDKKFYSIKKVNIFFKKLKEEYAGCYSVRKDKKYYDFDRTANSRAEQQEIEMELKKILNILTLIDIEVKNLNKSNIKENDFSRLVKDINDFAKDENILKKIQEKDGHIVYNIIGQILDEAEANAKNKLFLLNQKDKQSLLLFSQKLSIEEMKYLDLVPLLELKDLEKRSLFINELHKDETLPILHYNLEFKGKNIHVIPRNYKEKIKPYLVTV